MRKRDLEKRVQDLDTVLSLRDARISSLEADLAYVYKRIVAVEAVIAEVGEAARPEVAEYYTALGDTYTPDQVHIVFVELYKHLREAIDEGHVPVLQGYEGVTDGGSTTGPVSE